jgi:hypothetical protein
VLATVWAKSTLEILAPSYTQKCPVSVEVYGPSASFRAVWTFEELLLYFAMTKEQSVVSRPEV